MVWLIDSVEHTVLDSLWWTFHYRLFEFFKDGCPKQFDYDDYIVYISVDLSLFVSVLSVDWGRPSASFVIGWSLVPFLESKGPGRSAFE